MAAGKDFHGRFRLIDYWHCDVCDGDGQDLLNGDEGDDILEGGLGGDRIYGGAGVDTAVYNVNSTNFILYRDTTGGYLTLRDTGTSGLTSSAQFGDRIYDDVESIQFNDLTLDLTSMTFNVGDIAWGNALPIYGTSGNDTITAYAANDLIYGYAGIDTIFAGIGNDTIFGGDGNDTLNGDAGNDLIESGIGNDVINGGDGLDTITYRSSTTGVTVNLSTTTIQNTIGAGTDTITNVENLTGSAFNDSILIPLPKED